MKRVRQLLILVLGVLVAYVAYGWIRNNPDKWFGPFPKRADTAPRTPVEDGKQIVFGDLHAHTTISADAAMMGFPIFGGQGFALPMEACQFARHCAGLDFWSINDHAELTFVDEWAGIKDAIRACNAQYGGYGADPEMVSYVGWEWSQARLEDKLNYGHKNVIFRDDGDDQVPSRPIGWARMVSLTGKVDPARYAIFLAPLSDPINARYYLAAIRKILGNEGREICPDGVSVREAPADCLEVAPTPADLYRKLAEWGFDSIVIPHSGSWGFHTPPLNDWRNQLDRAHHDPERQILLEVYSGHGNSEQWKPWVPYTRAADGTATCSEPTEDYEPCCWRAGELARERAPACQREPGSDACEAAVEEARQAFIAGSFNGRNEFNALYPDQKPADKEWRDCDQCRDCFNGAFSYRPLGSAQAALAFANFAAGPEPLRYRFGLIGSTDEHRGRPGSGFKDAKKFSDTFGPRDEGIARFTRGVDKTFGDWQRQSSYWFSGGLVAAHATDRTRGGIWDALKRKEVYATSGKRILLWFDLLSGPEGPASMGSSVRTDTVPRFRVRAVGDWKQKPGCPQSLADALGAAFVDEVCLGECYHPSDERYPIDRIEIVRIRPQARPDEPLEGLIEDPWKTFECEPNPEGCEVEFEDPEYPASGRPAVYYARALHPPTPVFNAGGLRCKGYRGTECVEVEPCYGGYWGEGDDCMTMAQDRAWSSPIFVDPVAP